MQMNLLRMPRGRCSISPDIIHVVNNPLQGSIKRDYKIVRNAYVIVLEKNVPEAIQGFHIFI